MPKAVTIGAVCWILTLQFFAGQAIAQAGFAGYDLVNFDISLLGLKSCAALSEATSGSTETLCSPFHAVFNTSIIVLGLLSLAGIWLTRSAWPQTTASRVGFVMLGAGAIGADIVGLAPLDENLTLHIVGAVMALVLPGVAFLVLAYAFRPIRPMLAGINLLVGMVILLGGLGHVLGGVPFGRGIMERLAAWPQTLWYAGVGIMLLVEGRTRRIESSAGVASLR